MNKLEVNKQNSIHPADDPNERGSAMVIAILILVLLSAFVALALSRTASEAAAVGNETSEGRTFYAAQGSLEMMTRNFNKVFETKLSPSDTDFNKVRNPTQTEPGLSGYTFNREVLQVGVRRNEVINEGAYAGLYATRDTWRLRTTATDQNGVQIQLSRNVLNNRIPIFQFGIFYNDDMELHPGARFDFGGRVHSNGSMFLMSSAGIYFSSRVSAVGEIMSDVNRNGLAYNNGWGEQVFIKNAGTNVQLFHDKGSALSSPANGAALFRDSTKSDYNPDMPTVYTNAAWSASEATFGGNLLAHQKSLDLPLKISSARSNAPLDYVELIKRGKNVGDLHNTNGTPTSTPYPVTATTADSEVTASERYYNKTGLRISIADSKSKLPGCASGTGTAAVTTMCGVRLDGASAKPTVAGNPWDAADTNGSHGYQPLAMTDGYQATRLNGERFRTSAGEVWIKIEMVSKDATTNAINAVDVTEDILSLGVTEAAPFASSIQGYGSKDSRSVIKLQRFAIPGNSDITSADNLNTTFLSIGGTSYNVVKVGQRVTANVGGVATGSGSWRPLGVSVDDPVNGDDTTQYQFIPSPTLIGNEYRIVPFPIEMFDAREGIYNVDTSVFNAATTYGANVPWMGVMSMVDIDVANLKRFLDGDFNNTLPIGTKFYNSISPNRSLLNTDIPQNNGWVVYLSDRRGDSDFDGEYDMEDVFGGNDGILQTGENVNKSLSGLDVNYTNEAVKYVAGGLFSSSASVSSYGSYVPPGYAATVDHPFYRRGVRLINGFRLPGTYDAANSANTRGFTFASENGVYVQGNYNATGIASVGTPTPYSDYLPVGAADVPASVVGDAVYVLSNAWTDANSFRYPYTPTNRQATETYTRFAMIAGDPLSSLLVTGQPNQGSGDARLSGGVHNFKRYLENWGVRLDYCGSLINLYNSRNNTGTQKSGGVYSAPVRNWVFDSSFLDPNRLPPGTPYFQYVQTTGFQRTND